METEHFLPFRKSAVTALCAAELPESERASFLEFARMLAALVHHRYHGRGDAVLDAYQLVDPAEDERTIRAATQRDRANARRVVEQELIALAEDADFTRIDAAEMRHAFAEHSLVKVRLEVDDENIDTAMFFRRGVSQRTEEVKWLYGLRRRTIEFTSYSKVLVYVAFTGHNDENAAHPNGGVLLKLFQNVPRNDLEMLYPSVHVRMRALDKLLIGVPAVVSGIVVLVTKLVASLGVLVLLLAFWLGLRDESVTLDQTALVSLGAGLAAFGGYLVRQFSKFKNRKIQLMKTLSEHLYFRNLDNDAGVFHHLLDAAEESEVKQTLLTYHFLRGATGPLTTAELDQRIESWFRTRWQTTFDFEAGAGLHALRDLDLLIEPEPGKWTVAALPEAKQRLDRHWDNIFR
ncbi:TMEM143 family protein [Nocardia sp. NBC_01503]|uniref:TMEM143 family protein n=1 Tax=Nocardia sp. NBC_01503 TaxID=2975997 RepID=UPI002E7AD04B|nr:TMEM143 family protein [Nocardia sp. NBC_01503]WTL30791.1 TMEM143 family protein [Nocardia sp. NBC_01503]